jgi:hypothetical protein
VTLRADRTLPMLSIRKGNRVMPSNAEADHERHLRAQIAGNLPMPGRHAMLICQK